MSNAILEKIVEIYLRAYCLDCKRFHDIKTAPGAPMLREFAQWEQKHPGHVIEFRSIRRHIPRDFKLSNEVINQVDQDNNNHLPWYLPDHRDGFKENTDFKITPVAYTNLTYTSLASLASDTNLMAGASALAVDLGSANMPLDVGISGYIKNSGTAPTASREIDVYAYTRLDDTPTWPDTMLGTDAAKTVTTTNILNSGFKLLISMLIAATANQVNPICLTSLSSLFGILPRYWSLWTTHNSGQPLNGSGHNFAWNGLFVTG